MTYLCTIGKISKVRLGHTVAAERLAVLEELSPKARYVQAPRLVTKSLGSVVRLANTYGGFRIYIVHAVLQPDVEHARVDCLSRPRPSCAVPL